MTTADSFEKGITAWPGQRLYVPGTNRVVPGKVELPFVWAGESEDFRLPDDLYLYEVMDLDLNSDESLLAFMREWGIPNAAITDDPCFAGGWSDVFGRYGAYDLQSADGRKASPFAAIEAAVREQLKQSEEPDASWAARNFIHIDEARVRLGLVRDMTRIWALTTGAIPAQALIDSFDSKWWLRGRGPRSADLDTVLVWAWDDIMIPYLNHALTAFSVHVEIESGLGIPETNWGAPYGNPYQAMCLQLVNDIAEHEAYKVCANEACARLFVKQRGRASGPGSHSTGVAYCSLKCNRAVSQRAHRERVRHARQLAAQRLSVAAIAERMGVSTKSVHRYLKQD